MGGTIDRTRIDQLCRRVAVLLGSDDELICDVSAVRRPDARTVDALAHLQLVAMRVGREVCIRGASDELADLIAFMGLGDVLVIEPRRETKQGEEALRVEEEGDPPNLSAGDV